MWPERVAFDVVIQAIIVGCGCDGIVGAQVLVVVGITVPTSDAGKSELTKFYQPMMLYPCGTHLIVCCLFVLFV